MDVRQVHVRAVAEVVAVAEVDVAERLEVRDRARAHPGLLRRGEAEEELGGLGDQVGAGHARGHRHLLRQRRLPSKPPPAKPRRIDVNVKSFESPEPLRRVLDVRAHVGAEQDRDVVLLEPRVRGSLGNRTASTSTGSPARRSCGRSACRCVGDEPAEVRQPPRDRDAEPGRRRRVLARRGRRAAARALACASPRSARSAATRAVTISWWSGGTSTSTPSERTTRIPSSRCCSGRTRRRGTAARAGVLPAQPVDELVDPGRADGAGGRAGEDLPARELHQAAVGFAA